jgi:hypothetical protein
MPFQQSFDKPVTREDAVRLMDVAGYRRKTLELQRELAHTCLREAKLQATILKLQAKQADGRLNAAIAHVSHIQLVLLRCGHLDALRPKRTWVSSDILSDGGKSPFLFSITSY